MSLQVLVVGESDANTSWCAECDLPSSLKQEFDQHMHPERELLSVNYSGQAEVTAVITAKTSTCEVQPQAKKFRTHFDPTTEGYVM